MSQSELLHLGAVLTHIHTDYLWRAKRSWVGYPFYGQPDLYEDCARIAARGHFDMLFFGDSGNTPEDHGGDHHASVKYGARWPKHDMSPIIPLMARAAPGIGFGLTMSTSYQPPFHVARFFNALDHVTQGRIAWNIVTSGYKNEAANYGFDAVKEHDERYAQAKEHLQVTCALWDSVEKDALVMDKETGIFVDPNKVHLINHHGKYFNVRGPLPVLPSPQHRPVLIQAGQSPAGIDLAAAYAEVQFAARTTIAGMQTHRQALDTRLAHYGRSPRDCGILWQVRVVVADSEAEALEKERRFIETIPAEAGLVELSIMYGVDFSSVPGDQRVSELAELVKSRQGHLGFFQEILNNSDPEMTVAELGRRNAIGTGLALRGTPRMIVDRLEEIHEATGRNGGIILTKGFEIPGYLNDFVELVVPELQRRGLSRTRYAGPTLRENLS